MPQAAPAHPLVARALRDLGRREGDPALPFAGRRPWCARWAAEVLRDCGVSVPVTWGARRLLALLGRYSVDHRALAVGDVVGWPRRGAHPDAAHVGIVCAVEPGRVEVVSGNSAPAGSRRSDAVTQRWHPAARVAWAARVV